MMNHVGTQQLETDRLILRKHKTTDVDDIYKNWATDSEVCRFWQWEPHNNIDETKNLLEGWIGKYSKLNYYHWIIILKDISQAIGYIYFADIDEENDSVSVHYALSRKHWNKGVMTEACKCVIDFAFTILGAQKVHSSYHIDNPASGRVQQKSGMHYITTVYKQVEGCERISGKYCYYEITSQDWKLTK